MLRSRVLRARSLASFALASFVLATPACGPKGEAKTQPAPAASASTLAPAAAPKSDAPELAEGADPTAGGFDQVAVARLCDGGLKTANRLAGEVRALEGAPDAALTWEATFAKLDDAYLALRSAGDLPALLAVAHPDDAVRKAAHGCEPKIDAFETALFLDAGVAKVVKRFGQSPAAKSLPPVRARLVEKWTRDLRRNGLELDEAGKTRLKTLNARITELAQSFDENLANAKSTLAVPPARLDGLPKAWLDAHPPGADGQVTITTDYPDYFPILQYAKDRKLAFELYVLFDNRASDKNLAILDEILKLRNEKAKLLGYPTWADYVTEPRMAKNAKTVAEFLERLKTTVAPKATKEMAEFRAVFEREQAKAKQPKGQPIPPSDRTYLEDQVRRAKYGVDSKIVSEYLEVGHVKQGLLDLTSEMYGIVFQPLEQEKTWHKDVEAIQVLDGASGKPLGRFYFDLYPREGKYKHAAVFSIRDAKRLANGERLLPVAAIVTNFPKPGGDAPALMGHQEAQTFFHEFGHVLHHLLSEAEVATFAGTHVARDFVEAPSQMFEEWVWRRPTLDRFALHYKTGKKMPEALFASMTRARSFGRGLATQRQLQLAALDQAYHTREPGQDTTKVLEEIQNAYTEFKYVPGTHFQGTFGHLMGYDAGYYGYQWALSLARDLFTRFDKAGLLDKKAAADYRTYVLAPGSSDDEAKLVEKFLGRPANDAAYKTFLLQ